MRVLLPRAGGWGWPRLARWRLRLRREGAARERGAAAGGQRAGAVRLAASPGGGVASGTVRGWQAGFLRHAFLPEAAKSEVECVGERCVRLGRWGGRAPAASLLEFSYGT